MKEILSNDFLRTVGWDICCLQETKHCGRDRLQWVAEGVRAPSNSRWEDPPHRHLRRHFGLITLVRDALPTKRVAAGRRFLITQMKIEQAKIAVVNIYCPSPTCATMAGAAPHEAEEDFETRARGLRQRLEEMEELEKDLGPELRALHTRGVPYMLAGDFHQDLQQSLAWRLQVLLEGQAPSRVHFVVESRGGTDR